MSEFFSFSDSETIGTLEEVFALATRKTRSDDDFLKNLSENILTLSYIFKTEKNLRLLDANVLLSRRAQIFSINHRFEFIRDGMDEQDEKDSNIIHLAGALFFVYLRESSFRSGADLIDYKDFFGFVMKNRGGVSSDVMSVFDFCDMLPFYIMRDEFRSEHAISIARAVEATDVSVVKNWINSSNHIVGDIKKWNDSYQEKLDVVNALQEKLVRHQTAFNFVGLSQGFQKLLNAKSIELTKAKREYHNIRSVIFLVLAIEIIGFFLAFGFFSLDWHKALLVAFPTVTLIIFMFYFLRVALQDVKSISSQIMQIELRITVCQFIQSYADSSEELKKKNKEGFEKFESLIFSSIVSSDEKIPSTFDGMDQLTNLLKLFQK